MKNMILGDMSGYCANRPWESDEYRLDTPEVAPEGSPVTREPAGLAALGNFFQAAYQHIFNPAPRKVGESRVQP